ncbi:MAG: glycosyltransferase family 39 protein, partial [Candidatus Acidiferrales bacterium]
MPANPPVPRDNGRAQGKQSVFFPIVAALLLLLMAVLAGGAARRESATFDEPTHIGAGVSYLQRLDLRLNEEHPPLAKVLAALPLVIRGVRADYSTPSWIMSKEFFPAYFGQVFFGASVQTRWNDPATTLAWARAPMLLLTLALGWIVFVYGRRLGGGWGGLLCLSLYVAMPVFLTFGPLVLTDLAITLFSLTTLWTFAGVWREPSRGNVMRFALNLAGALLSKFSAGILFFAFAAFTLSTLWRPVPGQPGTKPEARAWRRLRRRATWSGILWAALFVYVVYFILSLRQPTDSLDRLGHWPAAAILRRLLMPPWLYLRGLFMLAITSSRPTFILSHAYKHGVWFYFPVVFLFKSPLGFLGLLVLAIAVALHRRRREPGGPSVIPAEWGLHWRALWTSLIVFTAVCMASRLDISFRHFTIPVVLLILMLAPLPQMLKRLRASA